MMSEGTNSRAAVAGVHAALMEDGQNEPQGGVLDFVRTKVTKEVFSCCIVVSFTQ